VCNASSSIGTGLPGHYHWRYIACLGCLSEDLKKNTFSCCQTRIQVWLRWEEVMLTRMQFINIWKHTALSQTGKTVILCWIPGHVGIPGNERADRVAKAALSLRISPVKVSAMDFHAPNYWCAKNGKKYGIAVMVTIFMLLIPQWVLANRMILSVGEMPSFSTGYRLVARVLHTHIFWVMTKHSVRHVILH